MLSIQYEEDWAPWGLSGKESVCPHRRHVWSSDQEDHLGKEWQPTPVFLSGKSYGQRSLVETVHGVAKGWATKQLCKEDNIFFQDKGWQVYLKPPNRRGFLNSHFSAGIYCPLHVQYPSACMLPGGFGNTVVWYKPHAACCARIKTFVPDPGALCCLLTLGELVIGHVPGCGQDRVSDHSQFSSLGNKWVGAGISLGTYWKNLPFNAGDAGLLENRDPTCWQCSQNRKKFKKGELTDLAL